MKQSHFVPRAHLAALGGTIASGAKNSAAAGVVPSVGAGAILEAVRPFLGDLQVSTAQLAQTASTNLDIPMLLQVRDHAVRQIESGEAGVVITQGTDCIEESSFVFDLVNPTARPIVVTGAMRNPTLAGADGPANVLSALQVAVSPGLAGQGAVVVFNEEIHDPWLVRKTHTSNPATFSSGPSAGPIGWISEGRVRLVHPPRPAPRIDIACDTPIPPVAYLSLTLGDDLRLLRHIHAAGYRGLVLDAFGGGHIAASMREAVAELAATMPVIYASRTGAGEILSQTYGFPGSETDLQTLGCVSAGVLSSRKARLVLSLLLAVSPENPLQRWGEFANRYS
ncbi:asparaginase [Amphibiibacter pelophylacis]|uniref:Asparaginase n=1 Tax=Amphibiibacter pelophylacis TaxID=1799477 RepID=A0ACC6P3Z0_9BURK